MSKWLVLFLLCSSELMADCQTQRVQLQILGSGGPELTDQRASTAYLIRLDGHALVLIDAGSGSALNFEKSDAKLNNLKFVLFSHLHVDHSVDFAAFVKAFYFSARDSDLKVFGPSGNAVMPDTSQFVNGLLGRQGVYRYLSDYVDAKAVSRFKIRPLDIAVGEKRLQKVYWNDQLALSAIPVHHGPIPALAWRVEVAGCALTFSGDMSNRFQTLSQLAKNSDILIAHHAIPETMTGAGSELHMPPSVIGKIAAQAHVKSVILSHRMQRTLGLETQSLNFIRKYYQGPVSFAEDMDIFVPTGSDRKLN